MRAVDIAVLLALLTIGLDPLASAYGALRRLFGIDLGDPAQRDRLAAAVAGISMAGLCAPGQGITGPPARPTALPPGE